MRASKSKQLLLDRKDLLPTFMLIQIPPRVPQTPRQLPRRALVPEYEPQQMPLETPFLVVHEAVPRVHHAEVVEKDDVTGLEGDLRGVGHSGVVEGVEGGALVGGEGGQGGGARGGRGAGDAGAGAIDEDVAGGVVWESNGAAVKGAGGGRACVKRGVSVRFTR